MKKIFFATLLVLSTLPAFAGRNNASCHVVAVDRDKRPIAHFHGPSDVKTYLCTDLISKCTKDTKKRGQTGLTCAEVRGN